MKKIVSSLLGGVGLLALAPMPSHATLQISALVNGSAFFCADQTACDTNLTPGVLDVGTQTIGGVTFAGSQQFQTIGPPTNALLTNSLTIRNTTGSTANIEFAVGGTGFAAPTVVFNASGSVTYLTAPGSTLNMSWYGDAANTQGAATVANLPGALLASAGTFVSTGTDSFSTGPLTGPWVTSAPYSWTMFAGGTLVSGATASIAGRSQDITSNVVVSEPGSLAILGAGLMGFGALNWFRRRRNDNHSNFAAA